MWDVDSGKELYRFVGHNGSVHHLSLSSDHKRLVSCSADGTVKVWDLLSVTSILDGTVDSPPTKLPTPYSCTLAFAGGKLYPPNRLLTPTCCLVFNNKSISFAISSASVRNVISKHFKVVLE